VHGGAADHPWKCTKVNSRTSPNPLVTFSKDEQRTIILLFAEQVARTPEAIALVFAAQEFTYRQLDNGATRLAQHLQSMGVGTESLVGVFMDRSLGMIIAMLAILKAGGAYVPLDPAYPGERIALLIEDSEASVVLTNERVRERLPAVDTRVLSLDDEVAGISGPSPDPVVCPATGANLAYVIYTSGSTGKPKGVMVEHRNVLSFFSSMDRVLGTEPGVWLAVTSISFDISVLELLWTLTRGFKVVLHGGEGTHTIAAEIVRNGVTHFQSTPSLARMLATDPRSLAVLGSVKKLLLGGEALPASLVNTLRRVTAGEIYNMYGPTETTIWSTVYRIPDAPDSSTIIPIGQPLANTQVYVLDPQLQPVPSGEPGELFLGGEGVVRGYWKRPEQTALRFLADPFRNGGRIYRTGDVVRLLPDGDLEFLGRLDFQVKLRGYRIELGEIEAVLEQHSAVRQAVVVEREDRPGDKRLVAYVIPVGEESLTDADLRSALESKLPEYMVPSHFVLLDRLPLTPNGKIDRNSLPAAFNESSRAGRAQSAVEGPRDEIECMIATVWKQVLGVEQVGVDENIFDMGATSLMMPEAQLELQRNLGREIPLIDLFEFHTVNTLAAHLRGEPVAVRSSTRAQRRRAAVNQGGPP
jgi:amino acid adenylation domain-containing protein